MCFVAIGLREGGNTDFSKSFGWNQSFDSAKFYNFVDTWMISDNFDLSRQLVACCNADHDYEVIFLKYKH